MTLISIILAKESRKSLEIPSFFMYNHIINTRKISQTANAPAKRFAGGLRPC